MHSEGCTEQKLHDFARRSSCLGLAFHVLSYYEEDTGHQVEIRIEDLEDCRHVIIDEGGCDPGALSALRIALPRLLGFPDLEINVACVEGLHSGLRYRSLVAAALDMFRFMLLECLRGLSTSGREYFYIAGWNGEYALGAGDEYSVTLPSVPGAVFAHTHPGSCYPSSKDLHSFADFFSTGGIAEFIVSPSCTLAFYLEEPFSEDDYWLLIDTGNCIARQGQNMDRYNECFNMLTRAKSLRLQLL